MDIDRIKTFIKSTVIKEVEMKIFMTAIIIYTLCFVSVSDAWWGG
jgi:hypothetical protein